MTHARGARVVALCILVVGGSACGGRREAESRPPLADPAPEGSAGPNATRRESGGGEREGWHRIGARGRRFHLALADGHFEVSGETGASAFASGPRVHVYGYAVAPITQAEEPEVLIWFARRDDNARGVVAHDSGWMDYGDTPWIHMHLGVLGEAGEHLAPRWVSSGIGERIEGVEIDASQEGRPAEVVAIQSGRRGRHQVRYRFRDWSLEVEARRQLPPRTGEAERGAELEMADLAFVGDILLGRTVGDRLSAGGYPHAFSAIRPWLDESDLAVGNLEGCFGAPPPAGAGPMVLVAPPEHVRALSYLGVDVLNLANNHCAGEDKRDSQALLAGRGISAVGARPHGLDREPYVVTIDGVTVGVLGGMIWPTTEDRVRRTMTLETAARLRRIADSVDFLAVTVHWGNEYASEPSPAQRRLAHWLIDQGVDAVVGHHPHVVQPVERYGGGIIAYSLGNFVFDQEGYIAGVDGATERGLLLEIRVHRSLGWTAREVETCISDRHVVTRCP